MAVSPNFPMMKSSKGKRYLAAFMLFAVVWMNGFQVVALQGVAWARMFSEYNELMSPSEALEFTVSGRELCGVCLLADDIREEMNDSFDDFDNARPSTTNFSNLEESVLARVFLRLWGETDVSARRLEGVDGRLSVPPPRSLRV